MVNLTELNHEPPTHNKAELVVNYHSIKTKEMQARDIHDEEKPPPREELGGEYNLHELHSNEETDLIIPPPLPRFIPRNEGVVMYINITSDKQ